MQAAVITGAGGPEVLELRDVPPPLAGPEQVLVRVRAAGLNRADLLQRQGRYPAPPGVPPDIPGLEFAGEIAALGAGVENWRPGQRVFGLVAGGAQAEYLVAHHETVVEVPERLDWVAAASVPEVFITAHDALQQAALQPAEQVLIHAVGSGVGLAGVQLARAMGAIPFGTSRTADKIERAREYGLEDGLTVADPSTQLPEWAKQRGGFDVVLDLVGGSYVAPTLEAMRPKGRIIFIGTPAGAEVGVSLRIVMGKRLTLRGTMLRSRPLAEKIAVAASFAHDVVPLLARGTLRPIVDKVFSLARVREAHQYLESNESFGKVVLTVP